MVSYGNIKIYYSLKTLFFKDAAGAIADASFFYVVFTLIMKQILRRCYFMAYQTPRQGEGRPPKYKTVEEIEIMIDKYFEDCKGTILLDCNKNPVLDKFDKPIMYNTEPLTITGLALALGFLSREALLNYQDKDEFVITITRAKSFCQKYAEKRLFDKEGSAGAKFSLQNNWNWREKSEVESTNRNFNQDVDGLSDDDIDAAIQDLQNKRNKTD